jgi:hypothetical protein
MPKSLNAKVFEGWVGNQVEIFTDAALNAALGAPDSLKFQLNVTDYSGASPTVVVTYYSSCDNVYFNSEKVYTTAIIAGVTQYFFTVDTAGFQNGGFGRVGIKMGQASTKAYCQLFTTGRTD